WVCVLVWIACAVTAVCLLVLGVTRAVFSSHGIDTVVFVGSAERTLEARLSGQAYSEFIATRTGVASNHVSNDDELKRLSSNPYEIGRFYLQHNDFEKGVALLDKALERQP